jgi:ribonucleoside-diphosphate reductase alpha chain
MIRFNKQQTKLLKSRYLDFRINGEGKKEIIETPKEMFQRVARFLANNEREEKNFFDLMYNLEGLPNSPTLWGSGKPEVLKSACAVLEINDSTEDILTQLKNAVILQKLSSGVGIYLGNIRARLSLVKTSGNVALGPVAVLRMYNAVAHEISQGGRRRGAFIAILPIWHEDIMDFIQAKDEDGEIKLFNISVSLTDKFMAAVLEDKKYQLYSPINGKKVPTRQVKARAIWDMLIYQAWKNGEPGFFFVDTAQSRYPAVKCTNPCAEALLEHKEFCNLGSINLMQMIRGIPITDGKSEKIEGFNYEIDWIKLEWAVKTMVVLLNRVIEKNYYPDQEYRRQVFKNRKIGIGVMGFADLLAIMRVKYSTREGRKIGKEIMRFIHEQAKRYSDRYNFGNTALTCVAPTGSISTLAGVSNGIEPIYDLKYTRTSYEGFEFDMERTFDGDWVETAHQISPEKHVRMLAQLTKHVDMGISKTINFAENATMYDFEKVARLSWELGIVGLACYRDGSRANQPLKSCEDEQCHL